MPHGDLAQLSAVIGGLGAAAMLLSRPRAHLLPGLAVPAAGEAALAAAVIPGADLKLPVSPASHAAALVVGLLVVGAGAIALARYPAIVPVALLAAAPFRISVSIGTQKAYLLVPLYVVLAAALLALLFRTLRGDIGRPLPPLLTVPAAAFVALAGLSLLWTRDVRQGTIELLFFLFPFSALVVAVGRSPFRSWHPRALATTLVALFAVAVAVSSVLGGPRMRRVLLVGGVSFVLAGAAFVAATAVNDSARQATSGRTRLARVTWVVFTNHPLAGVGIGGQPQASKDEANTQLSAKRDRSHTTPLTVPAELGLIGLLAYAALLAGTTRLLFRLAGLNRALGLGASAVFLALFVHSLFYSGFFEDPSERGVMALAAWARVALSRKTLPGPPTAPDPQVTERPQDGGTRQTAPELQHQA